MMEPKERQLLIQVQHIVTERTDNKILYISRNTEIPASTIAGLKKLQKKFGYKIQFILPLFEIQ